MRLCSILVTVATLVCLAMPQSLGQTTMRKMSRDTLEDRIRGAWAGQMIGVSYGAATEFQSLGKILEGEIKPEPLTNALGQDDLYVEMTFAQVMDTVGLDATTEQYGEALKNSTYSLWHANAAARKNLNRGIAAPLSGNPAHNIHADDIDFQIEADFIGIMCPGMPQMSNYYCHRVGRVMNYGDGLYGGMFVAGMYAAAFVESDPRQIVEQGLACLPAESPYARVIRDVLEWSAAEPGDWRRVWTQVEEKWNRDDPCPEGVHRAFNIDAKLNGAYIAIGLIYGKGDWLQTMEIATRCGQDSDCNPASAAGVLGATRGFAQLPDDYKADLTEIADQKFAHTGYSFNQIVNSTMARALEVVEQAGGAITENEVRIPEQTPQPPKLELSNFGTPVERVAVTAKEWIWRGSWESKSAELWGDRFSIKESHQPGDETTLEFQGTGIALVGELGQDGGRADIYVDGKKCKLTADAYIGPNTWDSDLWRAFDLPPGRHTLRLVVRDDADDRSSGRRVTISGAVVFQVD